MNDMTLTDRAEIEIMVKAGFPTERIMFFYRNIYTRQQIAGIRAVLKKNSPVRKIRAVTKKIEKSVMRMGDDIRGQIIKMIKKGMGTEQIRALYKNMYTTQQVAAIKAWVTMGKY